MTSPLPGPTGHDEAPLLRPPRTRARTASASAKPSASRPSLAFPVSAFAPVPLQRPLTVFGARVEVHTSTALTLSPDTVARAALDTSLQTFIRTAEPGKHMLLKKLLYVAAGKHRLSAGMKNLVKEELKPLMEPDALAAVLEGTDGATSCSPGSDWARLLNGMAGGEELLFHDIAAHLAQYDAQVIEMRRLDATGRRTEAHRHFESLMGPALQAWQALNPRLSIPVFLLLEVALRTLAWLECRSTKPLPDAPAAQESQVAPLLDAGRWPLGLWLAEVRVASGCPNLAALSQHLDRHGATLHGRSIRHALLKDWSNSTRVLMPQLAVNPVLRGVRVREQSERLEGCYYVARLLTFLCDLARSGTQGEAPAWAEVRSQIKSRYTELHRLELARASAPA